MYKTHNGIYFFYEYVESYSLNQVKDLLGQLYDFFLESKYISVHNGYVRFSFVGVAADSKNIICILPKYQKGGSEADSSLIANAKKLIRILKSYRNKTEFTSIGVDLIDYSTAGVTSEISLADIILQDYLQNGIWKVQNKNIVQDPSNEILWDFTIDNTVPIISKYPYYFDLFSNNNEYLTNTIITKIHLWALQYCYDKYSEILDVEIELTERIGVDIEDIGEKSFLIASLEKELRSSFSDRNIFLLKSLIELINSSNQYGEADFTLYGKNKFEHIWEAAIGFCYKNQYSTLKHFISNPKWESDFHGSISEKQTVKPDVIKWILHEGMSYFIIVDAKYYLFKFNEINKSAENNPGVGDIVKQYFYEFILSREQSGAPWLNSNTNYLNILAFPSAKEKPLKYIYDGNVSIENIATNKKIFNVIFNPDFVFECYYNNKPFSDELIIEMIHSILT